MSGIVDCLDWKIALDSKSDLLLATSPWMQLTEIFEIEHRWKLHIHSLHTGLELFPGFRSSSLSQEGR